MRRTGDDGDADFRSRLGQEGKDSEFQKHIVDADVLITTPFHPGYLTADLIKTAKNLKVRRSLYSSYLELSDHLLKQLCITAGVGSDHIDLNAANEKKIAVLEVRISVLEVRARQSILLLTLNDHRSPDPTSSR